MGLQNHHQDMNLVLSTDAKPRLKWTPELHQRFIDAITQLGGADKATPKILVKMMEIPGLTLYHLKSHLQKFRLGTSQQSETCSESIRDDYKEEQSNIDVQLNTEINDGRTQLNESLKVAQALQMQMEVQRKLHEQIEVQRHLQLRIEAQGKYLQSVLRKAQETLAGYDSFSSTGVEHAKAQLSHLVSMVNSSCSNPLSELTEMVSSTLVVSEEKLKKGKYGSMESSLTSSDSSGRKVKRQLKPLTEGTHISNVLPSVENLPKNTRTPNKVGLLGNGRKRNGSILSDNNSIFLEQPSAKRSITHISRDGNHLRLFGFEEKFDLNCQMGINSGPRALDLNCKEPEQCKSFDS